MPLNLYFFLVFHKALKILQRATKRAHPKKKPNSLSEVTIQYLRKNIIIPLLCLYGLFIHTCVSKNSIVSKDLIFLPPSI